MAGFGKFHPKTGVYYFLFFLNILNREIFSNLWTVYQVSIQILRKFMQLFPIVLKQRFKLTCKFGTPYRNSYFYKILIGILKF